MRQEHLLPLPVCTVIQGLASIIFPLHLSNLVSSNSKVLSAILFQLSMQQAYISEVRQRKWQDIKHKSENLRETAKMAAHTTAKMAADRAKAHTTLSAASVDPSTKS